MALSMKTRWLVVSAYVGCGQADKSDLSSPAAGAVDSSEAESGTPPDRDSGSTVGDPDDTAADWEDEDPESVVVEHSAPVVCEAPSERAALGPFQAISDPDGIGGVEPWVDRLPGSTMSVALDDVNGDGLLDMLFGDLWTGARLFWGQPNGTFREASEEDWPVVGVGEHIVSAVLWADVDDDADLDAVVLYRTHPPTRHENLGDGTFTVHADLGEELGSPATIGAAIADLDGDGALDLVVGGNHYESVDGRVVTPAQVYSFPDGKLAFSDIELPEGAHTGDTFVTTVIDANGDNLQDILFANDHGAIYSPNALLWGSESEAGRVYTADTGISGLTIRMDAMGVGVGDLNADAIPDFAVSNWGNPKLFLSDGTNGWFDAALASGLQATERSNVGWGTDLADYDNDGDLDLYMVFGPIPFIEVRERPNPENQPDRFFENDGSGHFTDIAPRLGVDDTGVGRTAMMVDLNGDGFLDLLLARQFLQPRVWLARCDESSWLEVRLEQPAPNRNAIGARVEVRTASGTQVRWMQNGGRSFGAAHPLQAHFGLGTDETIEAVRVVWPDGSSTVSTGIAPRTRVTIRRLEEPTDGAAAAP